MAAASNNKNWAAKVVEGRCCSPAEEATVEVEEEEEEEIGLAGMDYRRKSTLCMRSGILMESQSHWFPGGWIRLWRVRVL